MAKIFLLLMLGLMLLAAGLFGALQMLVVQRQLSQSLPALTGGKVEIQGLEGSLPQHLRVARLALRDKQGVWLEIERLTLDWHPLAWLHHEVAIDRLEIARLHVIRAPLSEREPAKPNAPFQFPSLPHFSITQLAVTEILLEPAVTGQAQRLTLSGRAASKSDGQVFSLALDTLEGTLTQLRVEATLSGQRLKGNLQAQEAAGGLFGHLAQIAPAASLRIAAQGEWDGAHLNATLRAAEDETVLADLSLASQGERHALQAQGVWPSQLRGQEALAALRAESGLDYHLGGKVWAENGAWHWQITQGNLGSMALASTGFWPQDADAPLQVEATIEAPLAPWSAMAGRDLAGQAHLQVNATGTFAALHANSEIRISALMLDGQALPDTRLTATAEREGAAWNLTPLELHLGEVIATGKAHYDAPDWNAQFALPPVALAAWRALLPPDILPPEFGGTVGIQLHAEGRDADWHAQANAVLDALRGLPEGASGAVGGTAQLETVLAQSGGALRIEKAELTSAGGLRATTLGTLENGVADLRLQARLADARVLGAGIPGGAPEVNATWKGKADLGDATFQLAWTPTGLPKLEAVGKANLRAQVIQLQALNARFGPAELSAEGTLPRMGKQGMGEQGAKAKGQINIPDLAPLGKLAGQALSGSLRGEAVLEGKAARATLEARNMHTPSANAAALQLRASVADWHALDGLNAQLRGRALSGTNWTLDTLQANAKSEAKPKDAPIPPIAWNLALQGTAQNQPLALSANGRWRQPKPAQQVVELASMKGHALGENLALAGPTMASFGPDALTLSPTRASWGALHATAQLTQQKGQVEAMLALEKVALDQLQHFATLPRGTLEAQARIQGPIAAPNATWSATAHLAPAEGTQAEVAITGKWEGGPRPTPLTTSLHATTAQTGGASGAMDGTLTTVGRLSLQPMMVELPPNAPLSGTLTGQMPLALLNHWLRADGHKLDGATKLDLQIAGTLGAPKPSGALTLQNASYDHLPTGLCLRNLQGEIQAGPDILRLTSLSATDAQKHRMQASGTLGLTGLQPVDLTLSMPAHHLFCGGMASGEVAGDLRVQGNLAERLAATGTLTIGPMAVTMPEGDKAGDIPQLKIIEAKKAKAKENKPGILDLAIDVSVPSRLFVRGRGLDAEFGGELKIRGTANLPDVVGDLSTKRGRFTLLDRQLSLTRAILRFAGPVPPSPSLDILAETNVTDTTLRVTLTGSALSPELKLDSTPALPADEVLALLLFGRKLESISAFQALQLAQAARQLAGKGGGPGAIDSVRNLLGLDTLSLDQDASGESTVGTGKYLADGVYVGLEQGRKPESRKVRTELEVIPDVNLQTSTTSDGQTGGGVEWKYDY